jgi:hypothetical protein
VIAELCKFLIYRGVEVHIITGVFNDPGADWQDSKAKREKLRRLEIPVVTSDEGVAIGQARLHILTAVDQKFDRDYRLADLGLRKGALCERLGIQLFIDDSEKYCEMIPKMSGATTVLQVR